MNFLNFLLKKRKRKQVKTALLHTVHHRPRSGFRDRPRDRTRAETKRAEGGQTQGQENITMSVGGGYILLYCTNTIQYHCHCTNSTVSLLTRFVRSGFKNRELRVLHKQSQILACTHRQHVQITLTLFMKDTPDVPVTIHSWNRSTELDCHYITILSSWITAMLYSGTILLWTG
jgi:hypothetical protein